MWTPKRILILIAGLALFLSGYGVYGYFLGGIDGLPPLPLEFCDLGGPTPPPPREQENAIDSKLALAFGKECPEQKRRIKLDTRRKGWGLAADEFEPEKDGRIKLTPFSAFMMTKRKGKDGTPEIHTVRADEAYLTLDRPISNMAELGSRKIIQIDLYAREMDEAHPRGIIITNNRGTKTESDDIQVRITRKPLIYNEVQNRVWTEGAVALEDKGAGVDATKITANEMEIQLKGDKDGPPPTAKSPHKKTESGSSVETLILKRDVHMWLHVNMQPGFFGSSAEEPGKKAARTSKKTAADSEKTHITIDTRGQFTFRPDDDRALFESPPGDYVQVSRANKVGDDILKCATLKLKFRRKEEKESAQDDTMGNKEIESAHATARPGEIVELEMATDKLHAEGFEMIYQGPVANGGSTTVIKGDRANDKLLHAAKEGHRIEAEELTLIGPDKKGEGQRSFAKGPGQVDLFDKTKADKPESLRYPWHAVWKDTLTSVKDKKDGKVYDLLTLTGEATFIDDEHKQALHGKRLQLWLEPTGPDDAPKDPRDTKQPAVEGARQKPAQLDAYENVMLVSPEMNITNAHHLVIYFKDGVLADMPLPETLPNQKTAGPEVANPQTLPVTQAPELAAGKPVLAGQQRQPGERPDQSQGQGLGIQTRGTSQKGDDPQVKKKPPIKLESREITAYVTRMGSQNFLRELVTQGGVHVHQDGATPKDKGVDIKGDMLNLLHYREGDILHVFGDAHTAAELQLGDLTLIGPDVTINQCTNVADVKGIGAMHLPAKTTLDGGKPANPDARLVIHWNKDMMFDGKHAEFHGGIEAFQESSSLRCQDLEVTLDRAVSFKEGQKGGQEAKVETMLCDRKVFIIEEKRDAAGVLLSYHRLEATQADLDNPAEKMHASGVGTVSLLDWANKEKDQGTGGSGGRPQKQPAAPVKELQLTRIDFTGSMFSKNKKDTRTNTFYDNVQVYQAPADRLDVKIDPDHPPKGGFYLSCDILTHYTRTIDKNTKAQLMRADGKVTFRSQEFFGTATTVKYDDTQDVVIFEGPPANPARLYQIVQRGRPPREINGTKILYNRRSGQISVDNSTHLGDGP